MPASAEKPIHARTSRYSQKDSDKVKPFLKWAGGKGQLLHEIEKYYPFGDKTITKYAEPFVGGGAVLFDILSKYDLKEVYISDINAELINTYRIIRDHIDELVAMLMVMQSEFVSLNTEDRKIYYIAAISYHESIFWTYAAKNKYFKVFEKYLLLHFFSAR